MVHEQTIVDSHNVSMTLKISAKGDVYGEFSCKASTPDDLDKLIYQCKDLYYKHTR